MTSVLKCLGVCCAMVLLLAAVSPLRAMSSSVKWCLDLTILAAPESLIWLCRRLSVLKLSIGCKAMTMAPSGPMLQNETINVVKFVKGCRTSARMLPFWMHVLWLRSSDRTCARLILPARLRTPFRRRSTAQVGRLLKTLGFHPPLGFVHPNWMWIGLKGWNMRLRYARRCDRNPRHDVHKFVR